MPYNAFINLLFLPSCCLKVICYLLGCKSALDRAVDMVYKLVHETVRYVNSMPFRYALQYKSIFPEKHQCHKRNYDDQNGRDWKKNIPLCFLFKLNICPFS